jgi:excisionase family DNA binding protein
MARHERIIDLRSENGAPLTTSDLARVTGLSVRTIQRDIALGELKAARRWARRQYRIAWDEAQRYARAVCAL